MPFLPAARLAPMCASALHVVRRFGRLGGDASVSCGESSATSLHERDNVADLPDGVTGLSLGSGAPVTLADLKPGETVLDLSFGGVIRPPDHDSRGVGGPSRRSIAKWHRVVI